MATIDVKKEKALVAAQRDRALTLVYVLFTECLSDTRSVTQPFINGVYNAKNNPFDNSSEINSLQEILDFFAYEHFTPVYDAANIANTIPEALKPEIRVSHITRRMALQTKLKSFGFAETGDFAVEHPECSFDGLSATNTMLSHMSGRKSSGNAVILLNIGGFTHKGSSFSITETHGRRIVSFDIAYNIKDMHKWLSDNRNPPRKYTFNPKHGDISKNCRNGYAQLKTSEADTNKLLRLAVGIDRDNPLWYYDDERKEYIYFENQREFPPNFHAYHVKRGEENYENIDRVKLSKIQAIP